jgi:hypothetical protein
MFARVRGSRKTKYIDMARDQLPLLQHETLADVADGSCVDGSELARAFFTLQGWSVQPCVRPLDAVHMTAGQNALRGSGPKH